MRLFGNRGLHDKLSSLPVIGRMILRPGAESVIELPDEEPVKLNVVSITERRVWVPLSEIEPKGEK